MIDKFARTIALVLVFTRGPALAMSWQTSAMQGTPVQRSVVIDFANPQRGICANEELTSNAVVAFRFGVHELGDVAGSTDDNVFDVFILSGNYQQGDLLQQVRIAVCREPDVWQADRFRLDVEQDDSVRVDFETSCPVFPSNDAEINDLGGMWYRCCDYNWGQDKFVHILKKDIRRFESRIGVLPYLESPLAPANEYYHRRERWLVFMS